MEPPRGPAPGRSFPIGATLVSGGANFSVFSRNAAGIDLLLFDRVDDARPARTIPLDPQANRTYHYWHVFVPGVEAGQIYGFHAFGPDEPDQGLRFDPSKLLIDPYARAIGVPKTYSREAARLRGDNTATAMKSVVTDPWAYDWAGDAHPNRPWSRTIIYELHVRGFTAHPTCGLTESIRGTYAGLAEKIPYLQDLGITAVELLPVFQFDPQDAPRGRTNYWGYSPVSFFAPHQEYSSRQEPLGAMDEFRNMVKAFHRVGIEVLLDVVFNHTAEGGQEGPTQGFRGLDNPTYYLLCEDRSRYANFSGTGNTLNANHPVVRRMIVDSLRYWVTEMHVDGFRFDLASILARDSSGAVMSNPPVLWDIESDPALAGTKMIAEAWDAAGLYQVGSFVGDSWKEWNDHFRDDIRDFFRGSNDSVGRMADRLLGSPSIYSQRGREAEESINFAACHDGFTLNDVTAYDRRHNEENGEDNHDGQEVNRSWNCGCEGPTDDPEIEKLRNRQVKNFFTATMLSVGVPMFLMGDEVRRSQRGNNNAYCQDNDTGWFDWSLLSRHADVLRFVKLLIRRRVIRDVEHERRRVSLSQVLHESKYAWHGVKLNHPDWSPFSHSVALSGELKNEGIFAHIIFNAYWEPLEFELPVLRNGADRWMRWIDTALDPPREICDWNAEEPVLSATYRVGARSVVVLVAGEGVNGCAPPLPGH
ncbi:MAG TPA: glycogen debranching protein GlgX [Terracidiphilus sp.]|nr:glycogen debranching protein GlgX [Terracidiphilus sp.]